MHIHSWQTAFRQDVLNPADGVFLFHARAIERLIEEQLDVRQAAASIPELPYYLMRREAFLFGLETENPEALSIIEGLRLPRYVILLPLPRRQGSDHTSFNQLRQEYWARAFEAEVARIWQLARDQEQNWNPNQEPPARDFNAEALRVLIGEHGFLEACDVLDRDGLILPFWDDELVCRSFIARVLRLRYFAPGARVFYFPAVPDWALVDAWLLASGLPFSATPGTEPLPALLEKTRPGSGTGPPAPWPLLPSGLSREERDPDYPALLEALRTLPLPALPPVRPETLDTVPSDFEARCSAALCQASRLSPRRHRLGRLWNDLSARLSRLIGRVLFAPSLEPWQNRPRRAPSGVWLEAGLELFRHAMAAGHRAERHGRFASALIHFGDARRVLLRLIAFCGGSAGVLCQRITEYERACEQSLADELAAKLRLRPGAAEQLNALVIRLAAADRGPSASPSARAVLGALEQLLRETRDDYYRLRLWGWIRHRGRVRLREMLPFQTPLRALRSLQSARARLDDLDWAPHELETFATLLDDIRDRLSARLEAQLMPRLIRALRKADFIPYNHRERVAEHKMRHELLDVIKQRRHLKFTDVRDIVARNVLRLPDPTLEEFFRGDRLRRFDHTAALALPGVYRPGELYIKGLQQLSAPLFGTRTGRALLRHVLVPFGATYLGLKSFDLMVHLLPQVEASFQVTSLLLVTSGGTLTNLVIHTEIGRHVLRALWRGARRLFDLLLIQAPQRLLNWPVLSGLLGTGMARGLARHLIQPLLFGIVPLTPIITLAVLVEEVPIEPGFWLVALAFALGTLARNTPAGRRFIDNLMTSVIQWQRRINQTLVVGLIQQLLYVFKEATRRIAQALHRVDEGLTHHLGEPLGAFLLKALTTPLWAFAEALLQFYITVLVEPQVNPVKHFPIVTIGHKLMLPFLPATTALMLQVTDSFLPALIAYPLVTLTIVLLPGLFGFVVWELKENWKLYQANHSIATLKTDPETAAHAATVAQETGRKRHAEPLALEPAVIGEHGETMRGILYRGFHSGALPKAYDRVRRVIEQQLRDRTLYPRKIRVCERRLRAIEHAICVFVDRELSFALRERCRRPDCALQRIQTQTPELATHLITLSITIHVRPQPMLDKSALASDWTLTTRPVQLLIEISRQHHGILMRARLLDTAGLISPNCRAMIYDDLSVFASRACAKLQIEPSDFGHDRYAMKAL